MGQRGMRLANYPILVFPTEQDTIQAIAIIDAIGEAYFLESGYEIADNPRRVVPKSVKTGQNNYAAAGRTGWLGPFFYDNLHYTLSPTKLFGEGWKSRYSLAGGPAYVEQMPPAEWFDFEGTPI